MSMYFFNVFQTLEYEESLLYKKIAVLISLLDEVIASDATSGSTSAIDMSATFDNAQLLQDIVESKIRWEDWKRLKGAGQGMWRYITNSCEIL